MNQPLVSIIIPVYNSEEYLAETISSALEQTWPYKEIIIVDDGSSDNSLAIAKSFESENIKVFHQQNKGASAARNKGIQEAKGDYIQFLDADDLLMSNKIASQIKQLDGTIDTLSICPVFHFFDGEDLSGLLPDEYELSFYKESKEPFEFLLKLYGAEDNKGGMIVVHSWLTPVSLIKKAGNWNESIKVNDDGEFFCRVVLASAEIVNVENTYCYYRKSQDGFSLSAQKSLAAFESLLLSLSLVEKYLRKQKADIRINRVIARLLTELLFQVYPRYPTLSSQIENMIRELGGTNYQPTIGGQLIEIVKQTLGWKFARVLQYYNPFK